MTLHNVKSFLLGEDLLEEVNSSLQDFSNQEALIELLSENAPDGPWSLALPEEDISNQTKAKFLLYFQQSTNVWYVSSLFCFSGTFNSTFNW